MATSTTTTTTTTSSIMLQHEENCNEEQVIRLQPPTDENKEERLNQIDELKYFLGTATNDWEPNRQVQSFPLPTGESLSCVFWNNLFHVTGTDIVRTLLYRFHLFGRPVTNLKKFEEGIFSDLRNLKPGMDASLEEPKSEFLEMLYKNNCIRTQKKQKVFFWFSVPHDRLFLDALERDLKREKINLEPTSIAIAEPATSLSLDTTQELFDQLRKSMSLSAVAAAHAMDDIPHSNITTTSNNNNTNSTNTTTTTTITTTTTTADDHNASYSHDNDDWTSWNQQKSNTIERTGHRPTRSLSSITLPPNIVSNPQEYEQTSFSAGTSPKSDHFELYPSFDKDESEKQKIFGAFSLFEGSPTYKQRQRRRTLSFNTAGYLDEDYQGTRLELAAINAGLAIINPHNLFQQSNHQHDHTGTEKVYTCPLPQCARIFKRLEHLKRHFRTHTLERPYSCNMCGKHFSRTDNLAQHKKTHNRTRSISVLTRCNSSTKLITLTNKSSDTSNPTTRKRASSLRNNCNEVIDKLSALSSDDNIHPNTTTTATENSIAPVDYFSYQGGDDISRYTNSLSPSGSNHQSDEEVLFNNTNFEQVIPYQMMDEDVYMADENEVNNNNVMYEDESYDTCGPYLPQPTASTSSSFMWQQPADPPCSTTSSSSSLLFNNNNNHNNQQYYHRLSWYSSMDDKSVSPKSSSPSSLYDNTQTYSWHQT